VEKTGDLNPDQAMHHRHRTKGMMRLLRRHLSKFFLQLHLCVTVCVCVCVYVFTRASYVRACAIDHLSWVRAYNLSARQRHRDRDREEDPEGERIGKRAR
jgi:hypothetical protein